jgi:hypothetical protein
LDREVRRAQALVDTTKTKDGQPLIVAKSVEQYERKFDSSGRPRA